jgi:hypothetical protein
MNSRGIVNAKKTSEKRKEIENEADEQSKI